MPEEKKKKNILSAFFEDEGEKAAPAKPEVEEESSTEETTSSAEPKVDPKVLSALRKIIAKSKMDGFEYLSFREVYDNVELDSEEQKFKAAMATVKAMKANIDILITSAQEYIRNIKDQIKKADAIYSENMSDITQKEKELEDIRNQIAELVGKEKALVKEIGDGKVDAEEKKATFDMTAQAFIDEINADIAKFKKSQK